MFRSVFVYFLIREVITQSTIDLSECGKNKGCLTLPSECKSMSECKVIFTYKQSSDPDYIEFELAGEVDPAKPFYLAAGLSLDKSMGNDAVTSCIYFPTGSQRTVAVMLSYNDGNTNENPKNTISLIETSLTDGKLVCRYKQIIYPDDTAGGKIFSLNKPYYLIITQGAAKDSLTLTKHVTNQFSPISSVHKLNFKDYSRTITMKRYRSMTKGHQSHGIFMLIGMWICCTFALFLLRYLRSVMPPDKFLESDHILKAYYCLAAATVGFVLLGLFFVLIANGSYWAGNMLPVHVYSGLVSIVLVVALPIIAIVDHKLKESKWNWTYWLQVLFGIFAWVFATLAIWETTVDTFEPTSPTGYYGTHPRGLMGLYTIMVIVGFISAEVYMWITSRQKAHISPMSETSSSVESIDSETPEPKRKFNCLKMKTIWLRIGVVVLFSCFCVAVVIVLICFISLS